MYQDRLSELEGKSDKFVQKFNELLDFTDHADKVFQSSGNYQKRTVMKLCFDGFIVQQQKLTPIWTPVFDVLMDLQASKIEPPKPSKGSKSLAISKVQSWKSGGGDFRNFEPVYTTRSWSMSRIDKIIRQLRRIYKDNPSYFEVPAFAQKVY